MNKIFHSILILAAGAFLCMSCADDNDSNPTVTTPTKFVLNTPPTADLPIDLANSSTINLTCSQPDYGFPASTGYTVQVALNENMEGYKEIAQDFTSTKIGLTASTLASTLTTLEMEAGKVEADFPMNIKAYIRVKAQMLTSNGNVVDGTTILSNVVSLNNVNLKFSLPPVELPKTLYVEGSFSDNKFDKAIEMTPVYGTDNVFWAMVYIDSKGVKFNSTRSFDGNEVGYAGLNSIDGDLKDQIKDAAGSIASSKDQWYLMVVTTSLEGRNILYDVQFLSPKVWLMGPCIGDDSWGEENAAGLFTAPADAGGQFESPAFTNGVPGGNGDGVRIYVKVPGFDWWKSEFIILDGKIAYRGQGGDQERVAGKAGQKVYLNFVKGTGEIK